ncbi:hypothetical protein K402DRAFT_179860 [Aulographum hederae CBS 113979]|uniref:Uncharacterized protein n=1 Tax=Aulographum hederae CBS 113979 TaxID=1176131 RepID=A0A6G1GR15_9PEZI|nr:hypothetical protein K402DRAFT_179860 [Aulographum hederae CBS 113979]
MFLSPSSRQFRGTREGQARGVSKRSKPADQLLKQASKAAIKRIQKMNRSKANAFSGKQKGKVKKQTAFHHHFIPQTRKPANSQPPQHNNASPRTKDSWPESHTSITTPMTMPDRPNSCFWGNDVPCCSKQTEKKKGNDIRKEKENAKKAPPEIPSS